MSIPMILRRAATLLLAVSLLHGFAVRAQVTADYQISPQDILIIDVVGEKDLGREVRVSNSGTITFAWLSNVEVKGKSPAEVEQLLRDLLDKDYLVEPTVLVSVKDYRMREISVLGQVNRPGSVVLPGEVKLTIVDAISRAGGFTKLANPDKVRFTRAGKIETTFTFDNLKKITDPEKIIYVETGDVIEIGEKIF